MGRGVGVVDLPVQRDALGFPTIFASSLKGPLRATFDRLLGERDKGCTDIIFGPSVGREEDYYAGAFSPLDAKLLLLPVRSLIGVYALTTSPIMLNNFVTYLEAATHAGVSEQSIKDLLEDLRKTIEEAKTLGKDEVLVSKEAREKICLNINGKDTVILADEFRLSLKESSIIGGLSNKLEFDEGWRLAVVHDDLMVNSLLERSLLRQTRAALETETKKVKRGALWTEEDLPPQTILYTVFFYSDPRTKTDTCQELRSKSNATGVKELLEKTIFPSGFGYMIFGGHETVGRGVAKLRKVG